MSLEARIRKEMMGLPLNMQIQKDLKNIHGLNYTLEEIDEYIEKEKRRKQ